MLEFAQRFSDKKGMEAKRTRPGAAPPIANNRISIRSNKYLYTMILCPVLWCCAWATAQLNMVFDTASLIPPVLATFILIVSAAIFLSVVLDGLRWIIGTLRTKAVRDR